MNRKRSKNLKGAEDFAESFVQTDKLISFIRETVEFKKLEKLNRRQLRSLVIQKWEEIKKRDAIELSRKAERIIINAAFEEFFALFRDEIPKKIKEAIEKKVRENKNKKQGVL